MEDTGIPTYLHDQYAPSVISSPSNGVKIVVPDCDVEEALIILESEFKDPAPDEFDLEDEDRIIPTCCPHCNSTNLNTDHVFLSGIESLLFFPLFNCSKYKTYYQILV